MSIKFMINEDRELEFRQDVTKLGLYQRGIYSIDLSPIRSCTDLKELSLHNNKIQSIDLTPLSSCVNLQELRMSNNNLRTVDLSALSSCKELKTLSLDDNPLQSIDLTPLSSCSDLQTLSMNMCKLSSVDLTPLSSCVNLRSLSLHNNQLHSIDLSPLRFCTGLRHLELFRNRLQSIDLTPLSSGTRLKYLSLHTNQIDSIDLSPLSSCRSLSNLGLTYDRNPTNQFKVLDVTPLSGRTWEELRRHFIDYDESLPPDCAVISWLDKSGTMYHRPTTTQNWSFLHQVAKRRTSNKRVQQDILYAMGLADYGFIDYNLKNLLLSIPPKASIEEAREQVTEALVSEIVRNVDNGGATTGLNLEALIKKHGELAVKAKEIIDLREGEMQSYQLDVGENDMVDLRELWLTAYGYETLTAMGYAGFKIQLNKLDQVEMSLNKLGFDLRIGETAISGVKMSSRLKKVIWWIAQYRGWSWEYIEINGKSIHPES
jgi:Leucine-rich repeat (LRR) protein